MWRPPGATSRVKIERDQPVMRALGACLGVAFLALGVFAVAGGRHWPEPAAGRALGLGLTLIVAGVAAIVASLTVTDPSRIW